jgi:hypothetical protein
MCNLSLSAGSARLAAHRITLEIQFLRLADVKEPHKALIKPFVLLSFWINTQVL